MEPVDLSVNRAAANGAANGERTSARARSDSRSSASKSPESSTGYSSPPNGIDLRVNKTGQSATLLRDPVSGIFRKQIAALKEGGAVADGHQTRTYPIERHKLLLVDCTRDSRFGFSSNVRRFDSTGPLQGRAHGRCWSCHFL